MSARTIEIVNVEPLVVSEAAAARKCWRTVAQFRRDYNGPVVRFPDETKGYAVEDLQAWIRSLKDGSAQATTDDDDLAALGANAARQRAAGAGKGA